MTTDDELKKRFKQNLKQITAILGEEVAGELAASLEAADAADEDGDETEVAAIPTISIKSNIEDDDDDFWEDNEPGTDDPFLSKIFINLILHYKPNHSYDSVIREMTLRLPDNYYFRDWIKAYEKGVEAYKVAHPENKFALPREVFSQDEIVAFGKLANEKLNIKVLPISNNAKVLGEILELDEIETLFLQLAIKLSTNLPYNFHSLFEQFRYSDLGEHPALLFSQMFGVNQEAVKKAMKGFLFKSGLLNVQDARHKPFYYINHDMRDAFCSPHITIETLTEHLFPSNMTTELTVEDYPHLAVEIERMEKIILKGLESNARGINLMLWGIPGTGKTELALILAKKHGFNLRVIGDISDADNKEKSRAERLVSLKIALKLYGRDQNTVLLFDEMEDLFKMDLNAEFSKAFINRVIETTTVPILWTTNDLDVMDRSVLRRMIYNIPFEVPPVDARRSMWKRYTDKYDLQLTEDVLDSLAETYDTAPALIHNATKITSMAGLGSDDVPDIVKSLDRLVHYGLKRKFDHRVTIDKTYDISCVNADQNVERIADCLCTAKPNVSLLLYGPPGTGKSEFGRYIAKRMGRRFMYKRASDLLGAYVGETEANIARMFEKASKDEAFLLIDEGDTFLRNREGAERSWEVSQVNEFLSQMERHDHPLVVTTNLMGHIDAAAMRRFTFKMKFDFLLPEQAVRLFKRYFGVDAPSSITRMETLTPGDYASVKKRADTINVTDADELLDMLVEEVRLKPQKSTKMGF